MKNDSDQTQAVASAAIAEHAAWVARNQKKTDLGELLRQAGIDRCELSEENFAPEDWAEWVAAIDGLDAAQIKLDTARARTRRVIAKATTAPPQEQQ